MSSRVEQKIRAVHEVGGQLAILNKRRPQNAQVSAADFADRVIEIAKKQNGAEAPSGAGFFDGMHQAPFDQDWMDKMTHRSRQMQQEKLEQLVPVLATDRRMLALNPLPSRNYAMHERAHTNTRRKVEFLRELIRAGPVAGPQEGIPPAGATLFAPGPAVAPPPPPAAEAEPLPTADATVVLPPGGQRPQRVPQAFAPGDPSGAGLFGKTHGAPTDDAWRLKIEGLSDEALEAKHLELSRVQNPSSLVTRKIALINNLIRERAAPAMRARMQGHLSALRERDENFQNQANDTHLLLNPPPIDETPHHMDRVDPPNPNLEDPGGPAGGSILPPPLIGSKKKKPRKVNAWQVFLSKYTKDHPNHKGGKAMMLAASAEYKKQNK